MRQARLFLVRLLLGTVLFVLIGLFGLGYAAGFIPPTVAWWLSPFAVVLPLTSAVLMPLAFALWLHGLWNRRWLRVAWTSLLLLLCALRFGPTLPAFSLPASSAAPSFQIMTFNVSSSVDPGPEARKMSAMIQRVDPDVVALQETLLRIRPHRPMRPAPSLQSLLEADYALPQRVPRRQSVRQVALSRRVPMDSLHNLVLGEAHPAPGPTSATRIRFRWQGQRVTLYNIHLHTVSARKPWSEEPGTWADWHTWLDPDFWGPYVASYREGAYRRVQQARQLRRYIEHETGPVLVVGDFNSTRHHWVYRHIANAGLQEAYVQGRPWSGSTYPAPFPVVRIDHVLASRHWHPIDTRVLPDETASDHRPVLTTLRLQPDRMSSRVRSDVHRP